MQKQIFMIALMGLLITWSTKGYSQALTKKAPVHFQQAPFSELPVGSIRPQGWLRKQLERMRDGSSGHLDEVYGKVKNDNGWLGGKGDGWEETPYWLDGALPLAYLLDDSSLKKKVLSYINWTLDHQRPSGYFGPLITLERRTGKPLLLAQCLQGDDWWPKMVMLKVLQQYHTASNDPRVIPFMTRFFHYQLAALKTAPLGHWSEWATSRGAENILVVQWLYTKTRDPKLLSLAAELQNQAFPWSRWLGDGNWITASSTYAKADTLMNRHGVNVAMGLKAPAVDYQRTGDKRYIAAFDKGYRDLMLVHGLPMGSFSADEDLSGNDPSQGTELCAIVETMYSLEETIGLTGATRYGDALERLAFNALPAQTTTDYNDKQYFQVANEVQISKGVFDFSLPFERRMCNVLGMRSGYTCCLANMHQGWTKFCTHLWYSTKGGIAAIAYAPNELNFKSGRSGQDVRINEQTDYPFNDRIVFTIATDKPIGFTFQLRIPAWCKEASITLNGKMLSKPTAGQLQNLQRTWRNGDKVELHLPMEISTSVWGKNSRSIERGPLVYALKLDERWEKGHDEAEGDFWSVYPKNDWNYGLLRKALDTPSRLKVETVNAIGNDFAWDLAHVTSEIRIPARKLPGWIAENGVAHQPVNDRTGIYRGDVAEIPEEVTLVPYGFTKVRIVAFPVVP